MLNKRGKIDRLNESLYSRNFKPDEDVRDPLNQSEASEVDSNWQSPELDEMLRHERRRAPNFPIMKKLFIFALVFCVAAAAIAGYIYIGGGNLISSKNVDISIEGPVSVTAGEPLELAVTVTNKNNADLTSVNMVVEYPDGTRKVEDATDALIRTKEALGALAAGKLITRTERALLFGQKGDIKQIRISLDYKVKGSNATFAKEKIYEISLGSAPVSIEVEKPDTISSGDSFDTKVTVTSNSTEVIKNVLVRAEYPYGYYVSSSQPKAAQADNVWTVGDLAPGDKKTISIKGTLTGQDAEERTFRFYVGSGKASDLKNFDTIAFVSETVGINKSPLAIRISINGEESTAVAPTGQTVQGSVFYKNNSSSNVRDGRVQVKLSGGALDKFSISTQGSGFYDSASNSIIWDKSNTPQFALLAPGDEGTLNFTFRSVPTNSTKNAQIQLSSTFSGTNNEGNLVARADSALKIGSEVSFSGRTLYSRGPFKNTGPIPPRAEKETTYTVVLDVGNTTNDVSNGKVAATLGPNVKWLGESSPKDGISYDQNNNKVTWDVGNLPSGAGFSLPGKEVSIHLSIAPSIGQIGSAPVLLQDIQFTGSDSFTGQSIKLAIQALTTRIATDPKYVQGDEIVTK